MGSHPCSPPKSKHSPGIRVHRKDSSRCLNQASSPDHCTKSCVHGLTVTGGTNAEMQLDDDAAIRSPRAASFRRLIRIVNAEDVPQMLGRSSEKPANRASRRYLGHRTIFRGDENIDEKAVRKANYKSGIAPARRSVCAVCACSQCVRWEL